jgi:hypothetical protein
MDDIAFFESSAYQHRGGIWSDAIRVEKTLPRVSGPTVEPAIEATASASAPIFEDAASISPNEPKVAVVQRSQSAEDVRTETTLTPQAEVLVVRSSTEGIPSGSARPPSFRRSSRLSNAAAIEATAVSQVTPNEDDLQRGRTTEGETVVSARSQSTPRKRRSSRIDAAPQEEREGGDSQETHPSETLRRSSSQHSSLRDQSESTSTTSSNSTPSKHPESSRSVPAASTSSTSSFFSTLKSRAGDKQALSNSAKEAMRKWGVNWGGFRKDGASGNATLDDVSDQGSMDSRRRVDGNNNILAHQTRASYAEVRAAVAERRGKGGVEEGLISPTPTWDGAGMEHEASQSMSPSSGEPIPVVEIVAAAANSSRPRLDSLDVNGASKVHARSVSRTLTETSKTGSEGHEASIPTDSDSSSPPQPIHTQPLQAKTMSIPGIHASHRGDVMSMGYVAPSTSGDAKPKNPTIQSVYRLWKSPILSGQQQQGTDAASSQAKGDLSDGNKDVLPLSLGPNLQLSPSSPPRPPPLPPRSISAAVSRATHDTQSHDPREGVTSASEVLKSIATKDEHTRASLERSPPTSPASRSVSTQDICVGEDVDEGKGDVNDDSDPVPVRLTTRPSNPGPPLPPRRIHTPT